MIFSTIRTDWTVGSWQYLLVLIDHFFHFVQTHATAIKPARTVADDLYNDFMLRYGIPGKISLDQGKEFENTIPSTN